MNGIHEVAGSIPASSTKPWNKLAESGVRSERGLVPFLFVSDVEVTLAAAAGDLRVAPLIELFTC